jgi:hypothetical protein
MSMKRNILKKCLSEDLTWADFLKNEPHCYGVSAINGGYPNFNSTHHVRSLYSTPERKVEIPSEYEKDEDP